MGACNSCMEDKPSAEVGIQNFAPAAKQKAEVEKPVASQETFAPDFMPPAHDDMEGARSSKVEARPSLFANVSETKGQYASPEASGVIHRETATFRQVSGHSHENVTTLQIAIRIALAKRRIREQESHLSEEPDPSESEPFKPITLDPESLLSQAAKTTLRGLRPFQYQRSIKGVANFSARELDDGSVYVGQWGTRNSRTFRKGKGKLYKRDGSYCEGYWSGPRLQPIGRIIDSNGDYYEGGLQNGLKSGNGTFRAYNRNEYKGEWMLDLKHGKGEETLVDGSKYEGSFARGVRNGKGKLTMADKKVYTGDFADNEITGNGEFVWPDGRKYTGGWLKGKMHGQGVFRYADGKVYSGAYVNDHKHGFGVYEWDGNKYEGDWVNGKMHGFGYFTSKGKDRKRYEFVDGVRGKEAKE